MAEAILFGIAEEVLKNLGSIALQEIASAWGFRGRLQQLKNSVNTIKDVLLDAEERQVDSHAVRGWLERLTTAVYAADDLFDEFATLAARKELKGGHKVAKEVRAFFSSSNQIAFAFHISQKIKSIRQELDDIVKDSIQFSFVLRPHEDETSRERGRARSQTYSFVHKEEVIGRDDDRKAILDIILASSSTDDHERQHDVLPVISIVGMGGLGKTTLAQLIYNDPQVEECFKLRLWVCVSDVFDIKLITEKILMSATNTEAPKLEMEQLHGLLQNEIGDRKYLLVLDDVWNEKRDEWLNLRALLNIGRMGSKVLVTTRSKEVAKIMGTVPPYELQGLSEVKSWDLFQKMAYEPGQAQQKPHLMGVGKEIIKKCANVPLAIRAVASLLYGKEERKWLSFKDRDLANISDNNRIFDILKISYQHLWSPLKNCFAYCALFPKDYEFDKETLMDLWMAEGFIVPINHEGLQELAEEYFLHLLQRCFFQDIKKDKWGAIASCKMHDLMHDLAQQVAGINCKVTQFGESSSNKGTHHLSFAYSLTSQWKIPSGMLNLKRLRTFLLPEQMKDGSPFKKLSCQELTSNFRCLRVLDLHDLGVNCLPSSIGKLIHLRYLNLSQTRIRELPVSITELQNLQTLNLYHCLSLRTLPAGIRKLKNLRSLDVGECQSITHMPSGLGELTSLNKLPRFTINHEYPPKFRCTKPPCAKLSDLKYLNNLRGELQIQILGECKKPLIEATEANLNAKLGLIKLHIQLDRRTYKVVDKSSHDEAVLEGLKPHPNLRQLEICWHRGQKLPSWATMDNLSINLPNLVEIVLACCGRCQEVPCFSQLPFLKRLGLISLESVEYMEVQRGSYDLSSISETPSSTETTFFPALEELMLMSMDNLKGWWKEVDRNAVNISSEGASSPEIGQQGPLSRSFSNVSKLWTQDCPKLVSLPMCPNVEELTMLNANESMSVSKMATASSSLPSGSASKLNKLTISNVEDLVSLPTFCLHQLSSLDIQDGELESTDGIGKEVFTALSSSLRSLQFAHCHSLTLFAPNLEHLTAMEKLILWHCKQLDLSLNEELPWKHFKSLRSLQFHMIPKLESLPNGLQHLANLHSLLITCNDDFLELPEWISCFSSLGYLYLRECPKLRSLPEAIRNLTALNQLLICVCSGLTERCRGPNGRDWPKIKHIPLLTVQATYRD